MGRKSALRTVIIEIRPGRHSSFSGALEPERPSLWPVATTRGDGGGGDLTATFGKEQGKRAASTARAAGERDVTATMEASSGVRTCVMTRDCEVMQGAGGGELGQAEGNRGVRARLILLL